MPPSPRGRRERVASIPARPRTPARPLANWSFGRAGTLDAHSRPVRQVATGSGRRDHAPSASRARSGPPLSCLRDAVVAADLCRRAGPNDELTPPSIASTAAPCRVRERPDRHQLASPPHRPSGCPTRRRMPRRPQQAPPTIVDSAATATRQATIHCVSACGAATRPSTRRRSGVRHTVIFPMRSGRRLPSATRSSRAIPGSSIPRSRRSPHAVAKLDVRRRWDGPIFRSLEGACSAERAVARRASADSGARRRRVDPRGRLPVAVVTRAAD